jgi:hypothetical protein
VSATPCGVSAGKTGGAGLIVQGESLGGNFPDRCHVVGQQLGTLPARTKADGKSLTESNLNLRAPAQRAAYLYLMAWRRVADLRGTTLRLAEEAQDGNALIHYRRPRQRRG